MQEDLDNKQLVIYNQAIQTANRYKPLGFEDPFQPGIQTAADKILIRQINTLLSLVITSQTKVFEDIEHIDLRFKNLEISEKAEFAEVKKEIKSIKDNIEWALVTRPITSSGTNRDYITKLDNIIDLIKKIPVDSSITEEQRIINDIINHINNIKISEESYLNNIEKVTKDTNSRVKQLSIESGAVAAKIELIGKDTVNKDIKLKDISDNIKGYIGILGTQIKELGYKLTQDIGAQRPVIVQSKDKGIELTNQRPTAQEISNRFTVYEK